MTLEIGIAAVVIGVLLGMLGGGGSILTVPMLVYMAHLEPKAAIATSLLAVGSTSAIAMLPHARLGNVCWRAGAAFGTASMVGATAAAAWLPGCPDICCCCCSPA
nr:TSUP family transporter [Methylogaea oryzae]